MPISERLPTVLLRHDLPDGTHHFDWMLARGADGPLRTFRVGVDISRDAQPFSAEPIGDHRRAYLEYEGVVSGGRGRVTRVARGEWECLTETDSDLELSVEFGSVMRHLRGIRQGNGTFLFGSV
jgi:hypothetical protein